MRKLGRPRLIKKALFNAKEFFKPIVNTVRGLGKEILERSLITSAGLETNELNPDILINKKSKDLTFYDTMLLDDRIKFITDLKKKLALTAPTSVIAASDDPDDMEKKEFVDDNIEGLQIPFYDVLNNLLDAQNYGFKIAEHMWKIQDGKWMWDTFNFFHSIFFDFKYDDNNNLTHLITGKYYAQEKEIPKEDFERKFIYHIHGYLKDGNYYGDSDLRELYPQWYAKFNIFRWRNVYLQNYGMPTPVVKYAIGEVNQGEIDEIKDLLDNFQDQMYLLIPALRDKNTGDLQGKFDIDFVDTGTSQGTQQYDEAIAQIDKQISRKLGVPDKLGFTEESSGSFAQSKKIFDILVLVIKDLQKGLENTINFKIRQLIDFNFPNTEKYPIWKFEEIDEGVEREMLQLLFDKGVIDKRESWIRNMIGIPELTEKEQAEIEAAKEEDFAKQQERMAAMPKKEDDDDSDSSDSDDNIPTDNNPPVEQKVTLKTANAPINAKKISAQFTETEETFVDDYKALYDTEIERLLKQVDKSGVLSSGDLATLKKLRIKKGDFKKLFNIYYNKMYLTGRMDASDEINSRLKSNKVDFKAVEFDEKWLTKDWINKVIKDDKFGNLSAEDRKFLKSLKDRSELDAGKLEDEMTKIVDRTVSSGLRNGLTTGNIKAQIKDFLNDNKEQYALTIARTNASTDFNSGRMNFFNSPNVVDFIEAYQYSAILDDATTAFCDDHDGQIILRSDPMFEAINPPNHFNCRSLLIPVVAGDNENPDSYYNNYKEKFDTWGTDVPEKHRLPKKGFGGN